MSPRPQSNDLSSRRGDERPVLPPIRDWFRDELSLPTNSNSPSMPYQALDSSSPYPAHQLRGMPGLLSPLPPSPNPSLSASSHFYQTYPDAHYRAASRSFSSPSKHSGAASDQSASYLPNAQFVVRSDKQLPGRKQSVDSSPYRSTPDAGSSSTTRGDHHGSPRTGRSSPPSLSKYECSYCGKGFNRPSSLKTHLNTHTGAKPFICPHESCGRAFSVQSNMRRHARVHTQQFTTRTNSESSGEEGEMSPSDPTISESPTTSPSALGSAGSGGSKHAHYDHSSPMAMN